MGVVSGLLNNANDLPAREMLKRMSKRIASGEDEGALIVKALHALERLEGQQLLDALDLGTRNRRKLERYFDGAISQAADERDALRIEDLMDLKNLLLNPPDTTRTIDQSTVDLALEAYKLKRKHPYWSYVRIATEMTGNPSDGERIKKAVQRARRAVKSVP